VLPLTSQNGEIFEKNMGLYDRLKCSVILTQPLGFLEFIKL